MYLEKCTHKFPSIKIEGSQFLYDVLNSNQRSSPRSPRPAPPPQPHAMPPLLDPAASPRAFCIPPRRRRLRLPWAPASAFSRHRPLIHGMASEAADAPGVARAVATPEGDGGPVSSVLHFRAPQVPTPA